MAHGQENCVVTRADGSLKVAAGAEQFCTDTMQIGRSAINASLETSLQEKRYTKDWKRADDSKRLQFMRGVETTANNLCPECCKTPGGVNCVNHDAGL